MKYTKVFVSVFIALSFSFTGCGESVMKSLQMASYYDKTIYPKDVGGLTLFGNKAGVNSYGLRFAPGGGGSGKNTYSIVTVEYPIVVKWNVEGSDGVHSKSFENLDGFVGAEIKEEVTIWLYFDEGGEPHFEIFFGDWMVPRKKLEEEAGIALEELRRGIL
jgi:hypothetical protein